MQQLVSLSHQTIDTVEANRSIFSAPNGDDRHNKKKHTSV